MKSASTLQVTGAIRPGEATSPDTLDTPKEAAAWIGMSLRAFMANVRQRKIPAVRINQRVLRFHRPTVLAALQKAVK